MSPMTADIRLELFLPMNSRILSTSTPSRETLHRNSDEVSELHSSPVASGKIACVETRRSAPVVVSAVRRTTTIIVIPPLTRGLKVLCDIVPCDDSESFISKRLTILCRATPFLSMSTDLEIKIQK